MQPHKIARRHNDDSQLVNSYSKMGCTGIMAWQVQRRTEAPTVCRQASHCNVDNKSFCLAQKITFLTALTKNQLGHPKSSTTSFKPTRHSNACKKQGSTTQNLSTVCTQKAKTLWPRKKQPLKMTRKIGENRKFPIPLPPFAKTCQSTTKRRATQKCGCQYPFVLLISDGEGHQGRCDSHFLRNRGNRQIAQF